MGARKRKAASKKAKRDAAYATLARHLGSKELADDFMRRQKQRERWRADRKKELEDDALFLEALRSTMDESRVALKVFRDETESFLRRFQLPWWFAPEQLDDWLEDEPPQLAAVFKRYAQFCQRFGVYFRRKGTSFEWGVIARPGSKFHLMVKDGQLEPIVPVPADEEMANYVEAPKLRVPPAFQRLIDEKKIKFVQIDDESGSSALTTLERYTYLDTGVTFVWHGTSPPYLFLLVGERALKGLVDDAGTAITAFQNTFGRGKGGRPKNLERQKVYNEARNKRDAQKVSAIDISSDIGVTIQSAESRLARESTQEELRAKRNEALRKQLLAERKRWKDSGN